MGQFDAALEEEARLDEACTQHLLGAQEPARKRLKKGHTWHRVKSHRFLVEVDAALRGHSGGAGLTRFQLPDDWALGPAQFWNSPTLIISTDQDPSVWNALNWMDYSQTSKLMVCREPDVWNHGVHNDLINATCASGLGTWLYAMLVVANLPFLPYRDGKYGRMIGELRDELEERGDSEPMFRHFLPHIAADKGLSDELLDGESGEHLVWNAFLDSRTFTHFGQKTGMCRWAHIFRLLGDFSRDWHSLLALLLRMSVDEDWLSQAYSNAWEKC